MFDRIIVIWLLIIHHSNTKVVPGGPNMSIAAVRGGSSDTFLFPSQAEYQQNEFNIFSRDKREEQSIKH